MKKQDILTPIGLLLGIGLILFGISNGDTGLAGFYDSISIVITIGGSFAALLVTFSLDDMKLLLKMTKKLFTMSKTSKVDIIDTFKYLSMKSRKDGVLSIELDVEKIEDEFMRSGLQLVIDGIDTELTVDILNSKISEVENTYNKGAKIYKTWGSYAPAFGMIGTLIGLIQMLAQLDNADMIATGMAKALITTFYGALLANLVLNPLGFNLQNKAEREAEDKEMILVGILSIKNAESTRILEEKLTSFLSVEERIKYLNGENKKGGKRTGIDAA